jgi:hypothetical protein
MILVQSTYTKNKRFFLFVLIAVLCICPSVLALDFMGPPVSEQNPGQFRVGIDYSSSSVDLNLKKGSYKRYLNGVLSSSGKSGDFQINNFDASNINLDIGYGIDYSWEVFVKLGASSTKFDQDILGQGFNSGYTPSIGGGVKLSLYETYDFRLGALAQINWANYNSKITEPTAQDYAKLDIKEIQVALGASYMLTEDFWLYGGPFYDKTMGDFFYLYSTINNEGTAAVQTTEYSYDIEQDSSFGGYLGVEWILSKDTAINAEYQFGSSAKAFGVNLVLRF